MKTVIRHTGVIQSSNKTNFLALHYKLTCNSVKQYHALVKSYMYVLLLYNQLGYVCSIRWLKHFITGKNDVVSYSDSCAEMN